jgi:hypothetical protein
MTALDIQVGGSHYKDMAIQPMEFSMANKLDACQHTIIKYVTRFRQKGGVQDLEKAKHVIDMLIEFERPEESMTQNEPADSSTYQCDDPNCPACYPENRVSLGEKLAGVKPKGVGPSVAAALQTLIDAGVITLVEEDGNT